MSFNLFLMPRGFLIWLPGNWLINYRMPAEQRLNGNLISCDCVLPISESVTEYCVTCFYEA